MMAKEISGITVLKEGSYCGQKKWFGWESHVQFMMIQSLKNFDQV